MFVVCRLGLFVLSVMLIRVTHRPGKKESPIFILGSNLVAQKFPKLLTTLTVTLYLLFV